MDLPEGKKAPLGIRLKSTRPNPAVRPLLNHFPGAPAALNPDAPTGDETPVDGKRATIDAGLKRACARCAPLL